MNHAEIIPLTGEADNAVYKITRQYEYGHNYYIEAPIVYAVWVHGGSRLFTTDYKYAIKAWEEGQRWQDEK